MSDVFTNPRYAALNDFNYGEWNVMVEADLEQKDLWEYVSGEKTKPDGAESSQGVKDFLKKQRVTRAFLITRVEASQLAHMSDHDPKVIWDSLKKVHRARGFASRLSMRRSFLSATMGSAQTMASWISTVKTLAHTLADIDAKPTDEDIIIVLTNGLPSDYNTSIATLDSVPAKDLTVDYVITRLANERVRLDGMKVKEEDELVVKIEEAEEAERALLAARGKGRDLKDVECYGCGE